MKNFQELGARISFLRESVGLEQDEMAARLDIEPSVYAEYELNGHNIPISVIYELSKIFNVDFNEILTGTDAKLNTYQVVKYGKGLEIERFPGYDFQDLAFRYNHKIMQPLLVSLSESNEMPKLVTHKGQEFNLVLEGKIIVTFDDKEFLLEKGDSIYFNPTHPHGQRAVDGSAKFVTVICE